jgi:hypothetical protein
LLGNGQTPTNTVLRWLVAEPSGEAYFHFIHAFGNRRRSYASEPIATRVELNVRSAVDQCSANFKLRILLIIINGDMYTALVSLRLDNY